MEDAAAPYSSTVQDSLFHLAIALAIGVLIGAERHWRQREEPEGGRVAGIRTFALSGLLGGVVVQLTLSLNAGDGAAVLFTGIALLAFTAVFLAFGLREAAGERNYSATNTIAGMTTFLLGALAGAGAHAVAVASAVGMAALLASRETLHRFVRNLELREFQAALVVLVMTFLVLPFAPDQTLDPWGGINPRELWMIAILTAAISFAGYIGVKAFGARAGYLIAGAIGGLSSSTIVVMHFSRQAKGAGAPIVRQLSAGALLGGAASTARAGLIAVGLAPELALRLVPPILTLIAAFCASAWLLTRTGASLSAGAVERPKLPNPLDLVEVVRTMAVLAAVFVVVRFMAQEGGAASAIAAAAITGTIDVHSVAAATPALIHAGLSLPVAAWALLVSVATSTLAKAALSFTGGAAFARSFTLHSAIGLMLAAIAAFIAAQAAH